MKLKKNKRFLILGFLGVAFVLIITAFVLRSQIIDGYSYVNNFDSHLFKLKIDSYEQFSAVIFILIFVLRTLLIFFPSTIMMVLSGHIFGPINGFICTIISVFLSSSLAFFISRFCGKEFVQKLLKGRAKKFDEGIEVHGLKIILLMRVSLIFPFDILNYAAGLSKIKYKDFIIATIIGLLPEMFSLTYLGDNLDHPFSEGFFISIALVVITMIIPIVYRKIRGKKLNIEQYNK